jgi:hypothetical protein
MTDEQKRNCLVNLVIISIKSDTKREFIEKRDRYLRGLYAEERDEMLAYLRETPQELIKYLEDNLWVDVLYKMRSGIELYQEVKRLFAEYEAKHGG